MVPYPSTQSARAILRSAWERYLKPERFNFLLRYIVILGLGRIALWAAPVLDRSYWGWKLALFGATIAGIAKLLMKADDGEWTLILRATFVIGRDAVEPRWRAFKLLVLPSRRDRHSRRAQRLTDRFFQCMYFCVRKRRREGFVRDVLEDIDEMRQKRFSESYIRGMILCQIGTELYEHHRFKAALASGFVAVVYVWKMLQR
jgi:hypothetical protein